MREINISTNLRITLTLAYLLCIYTTLGIARPIAEFLRSTGVLFPIIIALFVGSTPLALFWRYRSISQKQFLLRIVLLIFLLCAAFLVSALPEERLHFLTYGLAGWLICWGLEEQPHSPTSSQDSTTLIQEWLLPCLLVWFAGSIDELIQWWLPNRVFDIRDIIFNGTAGITGVALFATGRKQQEETA
jgi:hypothetical protein